MIIFKVSFEIKSDWHIGSGEEGGAYADALILRDATKLPYVPGKSVKGLFREAFLQASENNWFNGALSCEKVNYLFGQSGQELGTQGALHFGNLCLSAPEQRYFVDNSDQIKHLTRVLYSTAIDKQKGVAKNASLRGIEVAIPMVLEGQISVDGIDPTVLSVSELNEWLGNCANLILCFGAKRLRGFGQVQVRVAETSQIVKEN